ncbi:MAG: leucyl aminopeptidase [Pirellulales bacterium]
MLVQAISEWSPSTPCDALVVAISTEWKNSAVVKQVDQATGGWFVRLLEAEEISTKAGKVGAWPLPPGLECRLLVTVGLGDPSKLDALAMQRAAGAAAKQVASKARKEVIFMGWETTPVVWRSLIVSALNGFVGQDLLRKEKVLHQPESVRFVGADSADVNASHAIAQAMIDMRRLVNLPPNLLDPQAFCDEAVALCKDLPIEVEIWDDARLKAERCGALLAVGQGSSKPSRLMIFRYRPEKSTKPIALVGKGVTFDSGGLSIKPTDSMLTMKCDMAGAATVLATVIAAARLDLPVSLFGIVGLVENMISGDSMKLGDVIRSRSGKTIEMLNTDAEGRMVLADLLDITVEHEPECIVDFATLTGACVVALGTDIAGLMGNDSELQKSVMAAADKVGELTWALPMHSFFSEQLVGKIGDLKNMGDGRWGGATIAAKFLEEFVRNVPWLHLDIAGPAFLESAKPWQDLGATGVMVRTMVEWLRSRKT